MKVLIALRIFLIGTVVLLLTAVPIFLSKAYASNVIFEDNFDSGNANNWTPIDGIPLWQVKNINGNNMYGARIESSSTIIDTVGGPTINTPNYQIDFDYLPIVNTNTQTTDRNFDFRWVNGYDLYEVHFQGDTDFSTNLATSSAQSLVPLVDNQINHVTIILLNQHVQFILNGVRILDSVDPTYQFGGSEKVGMRVSTGDSYPTEAWFDNIVVTSLDNTPTTTPSPTPSPIPSPTPTPSLTPTPTPILTPTPTPTTNKLNVPVLRQTDNPWGPQTYDGANFWSPLTKAIKNWGCALTSYAMVLRYFGISKLPNGTNLDPGTLNTWLKDNNGYIDGKNSGYVNPLAISSLSKQAAKINKITAFDALEFTKINSSDNSLLANQINNNRPVVLEEPGHFIVANGINSNTFNIIDPYYTNRNYLTAYNNTFNSLNELIPSKTDLSYILVTGDQNLNIQIKDANGNNLGEQFVQQPLINPETNLPGGDPIKIDYFQKPASGNYYIQLSSNKTEVDDVNVYSYDKDGNVNVKDFPIMSHTGKNNIIDINFNSQNSNKSGSKKEVTFESLIDDINNLNLLHQISNNTTDELIKSVKRIEKDYSKKFKEPTKFQLEFIKETLRFYDKKSLSQEAFGIISEDIKDLIKSL